MSYIGQESKLTINGKTYRLARFDRRLANDFVKWARSVLPNPLQSIAEVVKDLPPELAEKLAMKAYEDSRELLDISSPRVQELLETLPGLIKLSSLLIQRNHPELSDDETWAIIEQCIEQEGEAAVTSKVAEATGEMPVDPQAAEIAMYEAKGWIAPEKKSGNP